MIESTIVLLLCRKKHNYILQLNNLLIQNQIQSLIIEDDPQIHPLYNGLCHTSLVKSLDHVVLHSINHKYKSTAWDCAFYFIFNNLMNSNIKYYYFIEDDVYSKNLNTFVNLIKYYSNIDYDLISKNIFERIISINWYWWKNDVDANYFSDEYACSSFNPLCRLSKTLIEKIYDHHKIHQRFFYHEFLFASLCKQHNLSTLNYEKIQNPYIGKIIFRPCFQKSKIRDDRIYHPVKQK